MGFIQGIQLQTQLQTRSMHAPCSIHERKRSALPCSEPSALPRFIWRQQISRPERVYCGRLEPQHRGTALNPPLTQYAVTSHSSQTCCRNGREQQCYRFADPFGNTYGYSTANHYDPQRPRAIIPRSISGAPLQWRHRLRRIRLPRSKLSGSKTGSL